ncbi:unnamed protein product [Dovyalis caffra]|uniref:Uncharacterized protein n=1 Tax=Dovyalis caffra TaxID=77055 RepID=A0AAV1SQ31_9ROSI|nr:unnamed protein product [Dovyalis caffra]
MERAFNIVDEDCSNLDANLHRNALSLETLRKLHGSPNKPSWGSMAIQGSRLAFTD